MKSFQLRLWGIKMAFFLTCAISVYLMLGTQSFANAANYGSWRIVDLFVRSCASSKPGAHRTTDI